MSGQDALFEVPAAPVSTATGEDLRMEVHAHLMRYPGLTAYEIARALHLEYPNGAGGSKVRRQLAIMEDDGEAEKVPGPRAAGDSRPTTRWIAT